MEIMKRRVILLSLVLSAFIAVPAMAAVTPEQVTDPEHVINQGYSVETAEDVLILKNRALGKPAETLYDRDSNIFVRGWRSFWGYVDPANVEGDKLHHNIKQSPSFTDL